MTVWTFACRPDPEHGCIPAITTADWPFIVGTLLFTGLLALACGWLVPRL